MGDGPPRDECAAGARGSDARLVWALAALGAALTAAILRRGIEISYDGWVYWEGSVSILHGVGYRDFRGAPIREWPPLYPVYLAAVQLLLGPSARAVIASTAVLTGAAILAWGSLIAWYARGRGARSGHWPAVAYAALVLVLNARDVRAENLFHALLPLLVLATLAAASARAAGGLLAHSAGISAVLAACLLSRNACLAFVPAVASTLALQWRGPRWIGIAGAALATGPAVAAWALVRWLLEQTGSHPIDAATPGQVLAHGVTLLRGIDRNTHLDFVGLPLLAVCAWAMVRGDRSRPTEPRLGTGAVWFVAIAALGLVGLFSLTPVGDALRKRFVLFVTLTIGSLGIVDLRRALPRRGYVALLAVLLLQPSLRVAKHAVKGRGPDRADYARDALASFLPAPAVISPEHVGREPLQVGERVLVSPP